MERDNEYGMFSFYLCFIMCVAAVNRLGIPCSVFVAGMAVVINC